MENEHIHNGLKDKKFRDLLAKQYRDLSKKGRWFISAKHAMREIERIEEQMEATREALNRAFAFEALEKLLEEQGWEFHDISEDVPYWRETYFPFVGTEKEFNQLVSKIEEE